MNELNALSEACHSAMEKAHYDDISSPKTCRRDAELAAIRAVLEPWRRDLMNEILTCDRESGREIDRLRALLQRLVEQVDNHVEGNHNFYHLSVGIDGNGDCQCPYHAAKSALSK